MSSFSDDLDSAGAVQAPESEPVESSISLPPVDESQAEDEDELPTSSESIPTPAVYVEPEVPDPFLIDDDDDDDDQDVPTVATVSESQQTIVPAHEISLTPEPITTHPIVSPSSNPNKDVPLPPLPDSESDKDEAHDLYLPGLITPTLFLPIPNVRHSFSNHLTWWLSRSLMYYTCTRRIR